MIIRGGEYPELWENNKLIGYFVGENPVTFEAKEPITFDMGYEIMDFLCGGESGWLCGKLTELNADFDWWDRENDQFNGKTPRQQYKEDPKPLYDMIYVLESGMPE